jgi:hypothetical protein
MRRDSKMIKWKCRALGGREIYPAGCFRSTPHTDCKLCPHYDGKAVKTKIRPKRKRLPEQTSFNYNLQGPQEIYGGPWVDLNSGPGVENYPSGNNFSVRTSRVILKCLATSPKIDESVPTRRAFERGMVK